MAEAFGVAASAIAVIQLAIKVCQGLVQYYTSWKSHKSSVSRTVSCMEGLAITLEHLRDVIKSKRFSKDKTENVLDRILDCESCIEELNEELTKLSGINPAETNSG